jgi:hypothetical protein
MAYPERKGVQSDSLRFALDGERICEKKTVKETGLEDGDQIDCFIEQTGGGEFCRRGVFSLKNWRRINV